MDEKMGEIKEKFKNIDFYVTYKINGGDLFYIISTIEVLEDQLSKETKRLNCENWELNQRIANLENYIKFKSLWKDFEELLGSMNKCSDGTKIPEGGCFGCEEGELCR